MNYKMPRKKNTDLRKESSPKVKRKYTKRIVQEKPLVELVVNPVMNINGELYGGLVKVPEDIAAQLRHMMDQYQFQSDKITKFIDHGVKNIGQVANTQ